MDAGQTINIEQRIEKNVEFVTVRRGSVYQAKDLADAKAYKDKNGGEIYHEQGTEIYRVFSTDLAGVNTNYTMPAEE